MHRTAILCGLAFALAGPATAQPAGSPDVPASDARFQIERTPDGFVRLDRSSGAVSVCRFEDENLNCRASEDERAALQDEIDRLAARVDALSKGTPPGEESSLHAMLKPLIPTDRQLERAKGTLEDLARRFMEAVRNFDLGIRRDDTGGPPSGG